MNEETRKKLAQDLPSNAVKTREQGGQKLSYIDGHFAVTRANEVFGHDGWSCAVRSICEVYRGVRPGRDGENIVMVYEAHVAVTALGITREDVGIGQCDASIKALAQGIEKGRKEAVTDGLKRALRTFGASFGLALYDKTQADVGASFECQELVDALDAATDAAALDAAREKVRGLWASLPDDERAELGAAKVRAEKRIAKLAPPAPPPANDARDLGPLGIEAQTQGPRPALGPQGRDDVREATSSTAGDNPTLGEHNHAVQMAEADAVLSWEASCELIAKASTLDGLRTAWATIVRDHVKHFGPGERTSIEAAKNARKAELSSAPPDAPPPAGKRTRKAAPAADATSSPAASDATSNGAHALAAVPVWMSSADAMRDHLSGLGHARAVEASVRKHGRHSRAYIGLAAQRLEALTPPDADGARITASSCSLTVERWAHEGPRQPVAQKAKVA
jgi:DNA recombination protein Rad52